MPEGAACVTRPGRWGNPFTHDDPAYAVAAFRFYVLSNIGETEAGFGWRCERWVTSASDLPAEVVIGENHSEGENDGRRKPFIFRPTPGFERPLTLVAVPNCIGWRRKLEIIRGRDLACFCPLDRPCHADVLLELANR